MACSFHPYWAGRAVRFLDSHLFHPTRTPGIQDPRIPRNPLGHIPGLPDAIGYDDIDPGLENHFGGRYDSY